MTGGVTLTDAPGRRKAPLPSRLDFGKRSQVNLAQGRCLARVDISETPQVTPPVPDGEAAHRLGASAEDLGPRSRAKERELQTVRDQVEQARTILADAVGKLSSSFSTMETETKVQKEIMLLLLARLSPDASDGRARDATGDISIREFSIETAAFLRQFTDMLSSVSHQSIRTVHRIDDMVEQLSAVYALIDGINGIAEETFILAVNASIEAARNSGATQGGHSFSVIATNIRELSKRTRQFNDQIGAQVNKARTTVNEVRDIIAAMASRDLNVALSGKERIELMMADLVTFEVVMSAHVDRAQISASRIAEATAQAVTALQFEDILGQLVVSIRDRAEGLAGAGDFTTTDGDEPRSAILDPVRQRSMTPGKVELF